MKSRIQSVKYAIEGIITLLEEEPNARIHLVVMLFVILLSIFFSITIIEWIAVIFAIGMVLTAEAFNTSIENVSNAITIEKNESIRKSKDIAAAAVLISALTAVLIGLLVFVPKILILLEIH